MDTEDALSTIILRKLHIDLKDLKKRSEVIV